MPKCISNVFILPMRNWNSVLSAIRSMSKSRFHLTYEELKLRKTKAFCWLLYWKFSSYLWGIETLQVYTLLHLDTRFSSYLWGIETRVYEKYVEGTPLFSSYLWGIETYFYLSASVSLFPGFHLTYEELKPMREWKTNSSIVCFHLTYEELKPAVKLFARGIFQIVFILPMRNWNTLHGVSFSSRCCVFILPMRNWNPVRYVMGTVGHSDAFSSYLWGIETGKRISNSSN